ncbi:hypothetical protein [Streptantibioticus silvisoli]|uniref:Uncharacterized protein n=1 Tax=Streptantibioticus silvisoli TaxID=2705255 RepID=A0ABT6VU94_9ACTN|nr:hypothetical protein [Streptantibioticus silvisoli]MDI5962041.1 hypothetical protein [Streptantibioticus silvisoli]
MNDTPPAIERLLARLCGGEITEKDYVGYFVNEFGEELVFAQRKGETTARLWHSDMDWRMFRVGDHSIRVGSVKDGTIVGGLMDGMITVDGMIIAQVEATWLSSCLAASRHLRPGRSSRPTR